MQINKAKSSSYNTVTDVAILEYCNEYAAEIQTALNDLTSGKATASRTILKTVAAELETVAKRLKNAAYGKY